MQLGQGVDQECNLAFSAEMFAAKLLDLPRVVQLCSSDVLLLPSQLAPQLRLDCCGPCRLFCLQGHEALERVDMLDARGDGGGQPLCRRVGGRRWHFAIACPRQRARPVQVAVSANDGRRRGEPGAVCRRVRLGHLLYRISPSSVCFRAIVAPVPPHTFATHIAMVAELEGRIEAALTRACALRAMVQERRQPFQCASCLGVRSACVSMGPGSKVAKGYLRWPTHS